MDIPDYACLRMPCERSGAPERHRTPLGRATAPRPSHTAALGEPGERTGVAPERGERRFYWVNSSRFLTRMDGWMKTRDAMRRWRDQVSNILLPTVEYPTRTNRADQNEVHSNELTPYFPRRVSDYPKSIRWDPVIPTMS